MFTHEWNHWRVYFSKHMPVIKGCMSENHFACPSPSGNLSPRHGPQYGKSMFKPPVFIITEH